METTLATTADLILEALLVSDDLRKPEWRGHPNPVAGHCYVASEALFWLGGCEAGFNPMVMSVDGTTHWFLRRGDEIVDLTASQFSDRIPYENARGCGFLTKTPSRRARILIERLGL